MYSDQSLYTSFVSLIEFYGKSYQYMINVLLFSFACFIVSLLNTPKLELEPIQQMSAFIFVRELPNRSLTPNHLRTSRTTPNTYSQNRNPPRLPIMKRRKGGKVWRSTSPCVLWTIKLVSNMMHVDGKMAEELIYSFRTVLGCGGGVINPDFMDVLFMPAAVGLKIRIHFVWKRQNRFIFYHLNDARHSFDY